MKKLRVLALMHDYMVPPDDVRGVDVVNATWKTEFDVITTLAAAGHDVYTVGLGDELSPIRRAMDEVRPHIAFNLMEAFHEVATFDQNVVSHLELLRLQYTGCNPRGLILSRDKALAKKVLSYDGLPLPAFAIFPIGRMIQRPARLEFPLIVKSLTQDASYGISQASVVTDDARLKERVTYTHERLGTDALVEQYIKGRELYVGVIGNEQLHAYPVLGDEVREHAPGRPPDRHRTGQVERPVSEETRHSLREGPSTAPRYGGVSAVPRQTRVSPPADERVWPDRHQARR